MIHKEEWYRELQEIIIKDMIKSKHLLEKHNETPSFIEGALFSYAKVILHLESELYELEETKK